MDYRQIILEFLDNDDIDGLIEWSSTQPELDQIDILREYKEIMSAVSHEMDNESLTEQLSLLEKKTDLYLENILDGQMASLQHDLAVAQKKEIAEQLFKNAPLMRPYIIDAIIFKAANAAEMLELGRQMIAFEKATGTFDAANWKGII